LRFRKLGDYTGNWSFYSHGDNINIRNISQIESQITKHNANITDDNLKFTEYNASKIQFIEDDVCEQFTGSFCPITNEEWLMSGENIDCLGRSPEYLKLKYNTYKSISEFENIRISDISSFDTGHLAVMYINNESDIIKIIDNKYMHKSTNMYKITPLNLAILLGRTSLALKLMKGRGHLPGSYVELIYMMDNDKLYTTYCNVVSKSCRDVDQLLVNKYDCVNISNNIHQQDAEKNYLSEFLEKSFNDRLISLTEMC